MHDIDEIPSVKKMQYFKDCFIDEAAEVIGKIKLTDYYIAWN